MNPLTTEMIHSFRKAYEDDHNARALTAAASRTELKDIAYLPLEAARLNGGFSIEVKTRGITAQNKTGRCWMYALLNIMREVVSEKCNLEYFELSENYLAFYDKLEKANNMLEMTIENADKPLSDRKMEYILQGFWDGGYWQMAADLVKKYGVIPQWVMPDTYQSSHTEKFMALLTTLLRKDMAELRKMIAEGKDPSERKEEMMQEIFKAECISFGMPPETFDFEYRDKDNHYHADHSLTPKQFFEKYIAMDMEAYVHIVNEPTSTRQFNRLYQFHYIGNMAESNIRILNLSMEEVKELCIKQLSDGYPVYFGCDHGAYGDREEGIWDIDSFVYDELMGGAALFMDKQTRLDYHDSYATHDMILVGVNLDQNGKPDRWKIENSWGKEVGKEGYFVCSDRYFEEYVYEAIIHQKYLNEEQLLLTRQDPIIIEPWEI